MSSRSLLTLAVAMLIGLAVTPAVRPPFAAIRAMTTRTTGAG